MKKLVILLSIFILSLSLAQNNATTFIDMTFGDVDTLDPVQAYDSASGQVIENVYEPLYGYQGDAVDQYEPRLATSYTVSGDGKTYTFSLREGVSFHSGNSFSCADVAYSIKRALVINPGDSGAWILMEPLTGYYGDINTELGEGASDADYDAAWQMIDHSVACLDDYTAQFNLVSGDPAFFAKMLFYAAVIVDSKWAIENGMWDGTAATWRDWIGVDLRDYHLQTNMSGTGAYQLVEWTPGQRVVAKAFDGYWGGAPAIKDVLIQQVEDQSARILALQNGDADTIALGEISALTQVSGSPGVTIYNENGELGWTSVSVNAVFMAQNINMENNSNVGSGQLDGNGIPSNFFSDLDMRKCLNYSFDQQAYIDQVLLSAGNTITMALPPSYLGYDPDVPTYDIDLEKAEQHCRAAWGGAVWDKGFEFTILYNTGNLNRQTIAEILKANLESLNPKFKVDIRGMDWPDFLAQRRAQTLPVSTIGWIPDYADPDNYIHTFYHSEGYYAAGYGFKDPEIDALDEQARTDPNPDSRRFLYSAIGHKAYEAAPYILTPQARPFMIMRSNVAGVYRNPMLSGAYLWKDLSKN